MEPPGFGYSEVGHAMRSQRHLGIRIPPLITADRLHCHGFGLKVAFPTNERRSLNIYGPTRRIAIRGPAKDPSKKCGGIALAGIDREYRRSVERCRSTPQSHSEFTFQYQRSMPLENWIGPVPSYVISGRLRASNAYARKNSFPSFARTAN